MKNIQSTQETKIIESHSYPNNLPRRARIYIKNNIWMLRFYDEPKHSIALPFHSDEIDYFGMEAMLALDFHIRAKTILTKKQKFLNELRVHQKDFFGFCF